MDRAPILRYGGIPILIEPFPTTPKDKDALITETTNLHANLQRLNRIRTTILQPIGMWATQKEEDLLDSSKRLVAIIYHFPDPYNPDPHDHTLLFHPHSSTALLDDDSIRCLIEPRFLKPPETAAAPTRHPTKRAAATDILTSFLHRPPSPQTEPPHPNLSPTPTTQPKRSRTDEGPPTPGAFHGLTPAQLHDPTTDPRLFVQSFYSLNESPRDISKFEALRNTISHTPQLATHYSAFIDLLVHTIETSQTPTNLSTRFATFLQTQKPPTSK
jgi:hypothetical protein